MQLVTGALLLALICGFAAAQNGGLSSIISNEDKTEWMNRAMTTLKEPQDIRTTFFAVQALQNLGGRISEKAKLCKATNEMIAQLDSTQQIVELYYGIQLTLSLDCVKPLPSTAQQIIQDTVSSGEGIQSTYYALITAMDLVENTPHKVDAISYDGILTLLSEAFADEISVGDAVRAIELAARVANNANLNEDDSFALEVLGEAALDLLASAEELEDGSVVYYDNHDSSTAIPTTGAFLKALVTFDSVSSLDLPSDVSSSIGEWLVSHAEVSSIADIYYMTVSVKYLSGDSLANPIAVRVKNSSVSASEKAADITVVVSDIFGNPLKGATAYLLAMRNKDSAIVSNQAMKEGSDGEWSFNVLAAKPAPGLYNLDVAVSTPSKKFGSIDSTTRRVRVNLPVAVSDVSIKVLDPVDDDVVTSIKGSEDAHFSASIYNTVQFSFSLKGGNRKNAKPVEVQQAFVVFDSKDSNDVGVYAATFDGKEYQLSLDLKSDGAKINYHSGSYALTLLAADVHVENPVSLALGEATLTFPTDLEVTRQHHDIYEHKPEIAHQFRAPDSRPPQSFSWMFTLIILSPIAILVIGLPIAGAFSLSIPVTQPVSMLSTVGFLACIGATAFLLWLYWVAFNLFEALKVLGVLIVASIAFGKYALRHKQSQRIKVKKD